MITGDHIAIAKNTCTLIGLKNHILKPDQLSNSNIEELMINCDGFAEV